MKTNPTTATYNRLTAPQRIRAAIMADARNDSEELERLKVTCPKISCQITDPDYSDSMEFIMFASAVRELDVALCLLNLRCLADTPAREPSRTYFIRRVLSSDEAWRRFADWLGVPPEDLLAATAPRCSLTSCLADYFAEGHEPDEALVEEILLELKARLPAA